MKTDLTPEKWNALSLSHLLLERQIGPGAFCVDATAGGGRDTAFLCRLCGPGGRVLAMDVQPEAVRRTGLLLKEQGLTAQVVCDGHENLLRYLRPGEADAVVFNLGWLPGGDHGCFTRPETTLPALKAALTAIKPGGMVSVCIYYGRNNGFEEKDAVTAWMKTPDSRRYTVLVTEFANRPGCPALHAGIWRHQENER
ncbi:MAG: class I SAM-dependent methyltransferase [Oscillospiraceae bacterium]|nr:class I SAM-dependent methyltransferase [Oscillospiraceae bacterium]